MTVKAERLHKNRLEHHVDHGDHLGGGLNLADHLGSHDHALGGRDEPDACYHELTENNDEHKPCGDPSQSYKCQEDADDQDLIGKRIQELAKICDKILPSCDLTVEKVSQRSNDKHYRRYKHTVFGYE